MDIITYLLAKAYADKKLGSIEGVGDLSNISEAISKLQEDIEKISVQADWSQEDETALDFIKNKPNKDDALAILTEMGFIEPTTATDGSIFTDSNGVLYSL